jgi:hypothetical protein
MGTWERKLKGLTAGVALLAPVLGGCSSDINWSDIKLLPKAESLNQGSLSYSGQREDFTPPPAGQDELVGPEGQCPGGASETAGGGVSLQMTECEIVRRVGAPERVDIGGNERGERAVVLTYIVGPRPGVYRFASGRLKSIERAPEPPPAARPQRAAPAKKRSSSG